MRHCSYAEISARYFELYFLFIYLDFGYLVFISVLVILCF